MDINQKLITGFEAIQAWNPTWKHHHMPLWFKSGVRLMAIKRKQWRPFSNARSHLPRCFDHWGSYLEKSNDKDRKVASMPYHRDDELAQEFANDAGFDLKIESQGIWHPSTCLYVFSKKQNQP